MPRFFCPIFPNYRTKKGGSKTTFIILENIAQSQNFNFSREEELKALQLPA